MQCSNRVSSPLLPSPPFLSLPPFSPYIFISFSFRAVISRGVRATRQRGTTTALGTVCQLVERDSNSIGWLDCSRPSWQAGPFRFFAPVPSFAFHRAPASDKTCRLVFLYFYIKRPFHRVRCDTHRLRSFPSTSGASASTSLPPLSSLPLLFYNRSRRKLPRCGQHETRQRKRGEKRRES